MKGKQRSTARIALSAVAVLVFVGASLAVFDAASRSTGKTHPVSREDAESLLRETVTHVRARDYDGLCRSVATEPSVCQHLTEDARAEAPSAEMTPPAVTGFTADVGQYSFNQVSVLHLQGKHADGSPYTSDFAVVHAQREGGLRLSSLTPIYWSGVKYTVS